MKKLPAGFGKVMLLLGVVWIGIAIVAELNARITAPQVSEFATDTRTLTRATQRGTPLFEATPESANATATAKSESVNAAIDAQETRMASRATATRTSLDKRIQDIKDGTPIPTPIPTRARPTRTPTPQDGQIRFYNARRTPLTHEQANRQMRENPQAPIYTDRHWEVCDLVVNTGFIAQITAESQAVGLNNSKLESLSLEPGDRPEILRLARDTRVHLDRIENLFRYDFMNFPQAVQDRLGLFSDLMLELVELTRQQMDDLILFVSNEDYIALARMEDRATDIERTAWQAQHTLESNCPGY